MMNKTVFFKKKKIIEKKKQNVILILYTFVEHQKNNVKKYDRNDMNQLSKQFI